MKGKSPYIILIAGVFLLIISGILITLLMPEAGSLKMLIPWAKEVPSEVPKINLSELPSLVELADAHPGLAPILRDAELGSIYKDFLIIFQEEGQESALLKAKEWGMITPDGKSLRVTLVLDTEDHEPLITQLQNAGLTIVSAYKDQVNIGVPIALITQQLESENPGAIFLQLSELDHVIAVRFPLTKETNNSNIEGEGISIIHADAWHQEGYTGKGVRIGILDLGFAGHEDLLGEELPDQVNIAQFGWYDEDEVHGTACAEIIHEIAPDAELFFAWYDGSDPAFGDATEWLLQQNVDIITHSAGTPVNLRNGGNFDSLVVDDVVEKGILWVNSSGNDGESHYRSVYNDEDNNNLHRFENNEETLPIYTTNSVEVFLVWEDNWESAGQDYDLAAYDQDGNILDISRDTQDGSYGSFPVESVFVQTDGDTIYIAVIRVDSTEDVIFDLFVRGYGVTIPYNTPYYSVGSPGDARGALTVGATYWRNDELEPYSSQGPTTDERLKPDISAPTGISGSTYGTNGFDGTSASTPHVAAAAALVWQAYPEYNRQEIVDFLLANSIDFGVNGPDTGFGYGRLQLPSPDSFAGPTITTEPPTETPTSVEPSPTPTKGELGSSLSPESTPTQVLAPTPTLVVFSTLEPEYPKVSNQVGRAALLGVLVLGPGCGGTALIFVGIVAMVRTGRPKQRESIYTYGSSSPRIDPIQPPSQSSAQRQRQKSQPQYSPVQVKQAKENRDIQDGSQQPVGQKAMQIVCPKCGTSQKANAQYCRKCGTLLASAATPRICTNCGNEIHSRSRFCPNCGKPLQNP